MCGTPAAGPSGADDQSSHRDGAPQRLDCPPLGMSNAVRPVCVRHTVQLLLEAGANPSITNDRGKMPYDVLVTRFPGPGHLPVRRLLQQPLLDQEHSLFLIKARRMVIRHGNATWVEERVAQGEPLPHVELVEEEEEEEEGTEEGRKLRGPWPSWWAWTDRTGSPW